MLSQTQGEGGGVREGGGAGRQGGGVNSTSVERSSDMGARLTFSTSTCERFLRRMEEEEEEKEEDETGEEEVEEKEEE